MLAPHLAPLPEILALHLLPFVYPTPTTFISIRFDVPPFSAHSCFFLSISGRLTVLLLLSLLLLQSGESDVIMGSEHPP